jgi:hypothetical protein
VTNFTNTLRRTKAAKGREGLSIRSTQMAVRFLKAACARTLVNGYLGRNPMQGVKHPKLQRVPMTSWSSGQARAFQEYSKEHRLVVRLVAAAGQGTSTGRAVWAAVGGRGPEDRVLRINRTRVTVGGEAIDSTPKTEAGRRSIPLDLSLVVILRKHKRTQAAEARCPDTAVSDVLRHHTGRPSGFEPETCGLRVRSYAFHGWPTFTEMGHDQHLCSYRSSGLIRLGREL